MLKKEMEKKSPRAEERKKKKYYFGNDPRSCATKAERKIKTTSNELIRKKVIRTGKNKYLIANRLLKLKHFRVYYNRHAYTHTSMLPEKVHWANPHAHTHTHHVGHSKHACYMLLRNVIGLKLIQPAR